MRSNLTQSDRQGLNLLIYPARLASPGRVGKIGRSLQATGLFGETNIVGIDDGQLPVEDSLAPGVKVVRVPGTGLNGPLGGLRIMLQWSSRVYRVYKNKNVSVVASQNVYMLPVAYRIAKKTQALLVYNPHELETESIGARGIKQHIARFIEGRYIRKTSVVSVVNESIANWYRQHYPGLKPVVLTNAPRDNGQSVDLRSALEIPEDELLYIHVGYLIDGRNIPLILKEFSARPNIHLVFLGDGVLRPVVERVALKHPNIHLLQPVLPDEVVSVVRGADVGLNLIEYKCLSHRLSTPNKMMEALSAGVPPLSSDLPEARRYLGPELSQTWVLESPERDLGRALDRITRRDLDDFRANQPDVPKWEDQAADLVEAYVEALSESRKIDGDERND